MIDVQTEQTLPLHEAGSLKWLKGRNGRGPDGSTLRRWALRGVHGVVLETVRIGNTRFTSVEACLRFIAKLNGPGSVPAGAVPGSEAPNGGISAAKGVGHVG